LKIRGSPPLALTSFFRQVRPPFSVKGRWSDETESSAQRAEELGYLRVWYAEHHNMASIALFLGCSTFPACKHTRWME
jgi:alkanesulfonate monooxygenase SsuD/methylene tetrahydromethanopterin reductase-like flavin-dependent oxidoreductase (luciferase family)